MYEHTQEPHQLFSQEGSLFISEIYPQGTVYGQDTTGYPAALFEVIVGSQPLKGYCVDYSTPFQCTAPYHIATPQEQDMFMALPSQDHLRWLLNHTPHTMPLRHLRTMSNLPTLTLEQATKATQAVIWQLLSPDLYRIGDDNEANVLLFAAFLDAHKENGWTKEELHTSGHQIAICCSVANLRNQGGHRLYGPLHIIGNNWATMEVDYALSSNVEIVDEDGHSIRHATSATSFFLRYGAHKPLHQLTVSADATDVVYGCDVQLCLCNHGHKASQTLVLAIPHTCSIMTNLSIPLGCLEIRKVDCDKRDIVLPNADMRLYSGQHLISQGVTDTQGLIRFTALPFGAYKVLETAPPPGYIASTTPVSIILRTTHDRVFLCNHRKRKCRYYPYSH